MQYITEAPPEERTWYVFRVETITVDRRYLFATRQPTPTPPILTPPLEDMVEKGCDGKTGGNDDGGCDTLPLPKTTGEPANLYISTLHRIDTTPNDRCGGGGGKR